MCCLSTFPYLRNYFDPSVWYWLSLAGQSLSGFGCPFISCVPTKISQNWFNDDQRILATTVLGLANPIGLVLGQLLTPVFVQVTIRLYISMRSWKQSYKRNLA